MVTTMQGRPSSQGIFLACDRSIGSRWLVEVLDQLVCGDVVGMDIVEACVTAGEIDRIVTDRSSLLEDLPIHVPIHAVLSGQRNLGVDLEPLVRADKGRWEHLSGGHPEVVSLRI